MKLKLKDIYLFRNIDDNTLNKIEKFTTSVKYQKENIIFYEKEEPKNLFYLVSGVIKLYKMSSHDKEIILKYFHPNELIAEVANFEHMPYPATAKAFTDIEILKIDFEKLKQVIYMDKELAFIMQASLISKIKNLEYIINRHLVLDAKERVAQFIHDFPDDFFSMKNFEIAEILNISPETLSRILKTLKNDKCIDIKTKTINKTNLSKLFL